jgi:protease-4
VAVLPLTGMIMQGESAGPPGGLPLPLPLLDEGRMGDLTVVRQARNLLRDEQAKAVVLWIDSGGGSAAASEAMAAALDELARDRPLVAYFNAVAASGGYYIATPARWIVAQPGTVTGSIGVVLAKAVTRGLFERLRANRIELTRGANAGLFSDGAPFTDAQRAIMRQGIEETYRLFVERVAASRGLTPEAVDAVGGGRVWTGQQALERGLVDELGDLRAAVAKARALAGLPENAPAYLVQGPGQPLGPQARQAADPAAGLRHAAAVFEAFTGGRALFLLPFRWK